MKAEPQYSLKQRREPKSYDSNIPSTTGVATGNCTASCKHNAQLYKQLTPRNSNYTALSSSLVKFRACNDLFFLISAANLSKLTIDYHLIF